MPWDRPRMSGGQEAFFGGHEYAFRVRGGVPTGRVTWLAHSAGAGRSFGDP